MAKSAACKVKVCSKNVALDFCRGSMMEFSDRKKYCVNKVLWGSSEFWHIRRQHISTDCAIVTVTNIGKDFPVKKQATWQKLEYKILCNNSSSKINK